MATYVKSPPTQSGVGNTRTSITKTLTLGDAFTYVSYEVSSEASFDVFRIYFDGVLQFTDSGTGAGPQIATLSGTGAATAVRFEYEKDGSDNAGTDNVKVFYVQAWSTYPDGPDILAQYDFAGTSGSGPPTGWTEILNDGGVTVTGSHWTFIDEAAGGSLSPSLVTNTNSFFGPTTTQDMAPGLVTNTQTFFAPTVSGTTDTTLTPSLLTNDQTFFAPAITLDLAPALLSDGQTFYAPALIQDIAPGLYSNAQTFYAPTVAATFVPPDLAGFLLLNDGRHRAHVEADDFRAALRGSRIRAALEDEDHSASIEGSRHIAALSEG